jgi:hypothetical protein
MRHALLDQALRGAVLRHLFGARNEVRYDPDVAGKVAGAFGLAIVVGDAAKNAHPGHTIEPDDPAPQIPGRAASDHRHVRVLDRFLAGVAAVTDMDAVAAIAQELAADPLESRYAVACLEAPTPGLLEDDVVHRHIRNPGDLAAEGLPGDLDPMGDWVGIAAQANMQPPAGRVPPEAALLHVPARRGGTEPHVIDEDLLAGIIFLTDGIGPI